VTTTRPALPPELDPRGPRRPSAPARRPSGRRWGRVLSWIAVVLSSLVLIATVGGYALYRYYDGNINRINPFGVNVPGARDTAGMNVLLVGSDSRSGKNSIYNAAPGSADYTSGQRSDTVMFVHIPPGKTARATIVSIPRDTLVQIPAFTDKSGYHPATQTKFNAAFAVGGPKLLVQTVETLTRMKVDHYVEIDFSGFKQMVNAIHGVTVCTRTPRHEPLSGDYLPAGVHHINGTQALAFVRDRESFADQDFGRIRSQQYFLSVVLHKVLSAGTLLNPLRINGFLRAVTSATTTDMSFGELQNFAVRMRHLDPAHVAFVTLPSEWNGRYVVVDQAKATALFDQLANDSKPKATVPGKLTVKPSAISVHVENGSGIAGLGRRTATALSGVGFITNGTATNADRADYEHSVVRYGTGNEAAARTLVAAVPGATMQQDSSLGSALVLVVGSDYTGVQAVNVGSGATAKPKTPASTAPAPSNPAGAKTAADMACAP
jgi:LCP family protein required for cell wall assembly